MLARSDTRQLYNKIGSVALTANGHRYSTGPIESLQLVHYRSLTTEGLWLFNETAEIILNTQFGAENVASSDEVSEFVITGVFTLNSFSDRRTNFLQWTTKQMSSPEEMRHMSLFLRWTVFLGPGRDERIRYREYTLR